MKLFIYRGLGFPLKLPNVEMFNFGGELHPIIDVKKVADFAIKSLVERQRPWTGNQINFMRVYFSLDHKQFGAIVKEPALEIKRWESLGNKPVKIAKDRVALLRDYLGVQILAKVKEKKFDQSVGRLGFFSKQKPVGKNVGLGEDKVSRRKKNK